MPKRKKIDTFSVTKAVKANARERLGSPPPGAPIPDRRTKAEHGPEKHKKTLSDVLEPAEEV